MARHTGLNHMPPLPVTIVSGYLGAGKTTLVNAILAGDHGLRIAVLVNDFGSISVDEALITGRGADVIALTNGCMCCQVGGGLYDAMDQILRMRERLDHLLIETSGVADPGTIAQIAVAEPDLELSRTVVLVDAVNFPACLSDPRLEDTLLRQVRSADIVLLTKTEAAAAADLADLQLTLAESRASAPVAVLREDDPDAWALLSRGPVPAAGEHKIASHHHAPPFDSWSWEGVDRISADDLFAFASDPELRAYRLKGHFHCNDGRSILLHKVGAEVTITAARDTFETAILAAVGVRPEFDPADLERRWAGLISGGGRGGRGAPRSSGCRQDRLARPRH